MMYEYKPLPGHKAGVLVVAIAATVSAVLVTSTLLYALWMIVSFKRKSAYERSVAENDPSHRGVKFLTSDFGILFCSLMFGELLQAMGFILNYEWYARNAYPITFTPTCRAQGIFIQLGDMATAFSSFLLAIHLFAMIVCSYKFSRPLLFGCLLLIWAVVALFAGLGPAQIARNGVAFYGWAGSWCWISPNYEIYRLWFHYLFVFIVAAGNIVLYACIFFKLVRSRKQAGASGNGTSNVAQVMLIYPLVYLICILPISTMRIAALAGHHIPVQASQAAGALFTLSGAVDSIVYVLTRQIVNVSGVQSVIRDLRRKSAGGSVDESRARSSRLSQNNLGSQQYPSTSQPSPTSAAFLISAEMSESKSKRSIGPTERV